MNLMYGRLNLKLINTTIASQSNISQEVIGKSINVFCDKVRSEYPMRITRLQSTVDCIERSMIVIVMMGIAACSQTQPLAPSYDELSREGFYAYVVPDNLSQQRGWSQSISIWDYTFHCRGDNNENPISVKYRDESGSIVLEVLIGNWTGAWEWSKIRESVRLSTTWSKSSEGEYYITSSQGTPVLMFTDQFGFQVQIWSKYSVVETIDIINQLEYVGPDPATVINPWDNCG